MWRHIDVQADRRRSSWTYGRAPNAIDISRGSLEIIQKELLRIIRMLRSLNYGRAPNAIDIS